MPTISPHRRRAGFSLIELLVVIGIIAILIAILIPVLTKTREQSNRVQCLSNLRSLAQALTLYANTNKDRLPNQNKALTAVDPAAADVVLVALNRDYVRSAGVFHCRSDIDPVPEKIDTADYLLPNSARTSYDFYCVFWMPEFGPKLPMVKHAPLVWDLMGGTPFPVTQPNQNHGVKGGNVAFADGHAEWQEQKLWDNKNWPNPADKYYKWK
jgi:prepilin-type N-terminal cleavage/methylation domain-containing protein/prepilin-type processing-associated H-X9-DG protein